MGQLIHAVLTMPAWAVYGAVAALAFGESAAFVGLVLPGETALLLGGVVAASGRISLPVMVVLAIVAAVVGDSVGYEIGRVGGLAMRGSRAGRFIGAARWDRAETFMTRHGGWAVFGGRWVGLMRALVPALAGMTRMPYRRFLLFNVAGAALWATAVVLGGYLAGASWQRAQAYLGQASVVLAIVVAGVIAIAVAGRWLMRRRAKA
ncbi:DedA family protein [Asanoa ferruginea]|uniref:DedA family protein n=1 Tax=Asanoa ferruginea TaxID=53367 RepID=UPI0011C0D7C3|nr:DedA family protein [Asanoa ferruginea]